MARRLSKLTLGPDLILPLEAATRRQAIVATSGAGKSNAAVVMAEQMYRAGVPWVAIDPKGDWYGIRSNADGTGPGLNVPVLGGAHADVPLDPTAGAVVARMIAERRMTCVLDVSEFDTRQDGFRFLADFAETLLKLNRTTLHLFLEEAEEYLPQKMDEKGNLPRCLGAWGRLVRRGRNHGIGSTLITQRTAVVSKDVLYLAEALYAMRVSAEPDRKVIRGWVTTKHVGADIVDQLPELDDGEAFVISPGWLKRVDRIKFDRRTTFDSGATPVFGDDVVAAKLAPVDLAALTAELSEVIERAAADDPDRLRAQLKVSENATRIAESNLVTAHRDLDAERERVAALNLRLVNNPRKTERRVAIWPTKADVDSSVDELRGALYEHDQALDLLRGIRGHLVDALAAAERAQARQTSTNGPDWTETVVVDPGGGLGVDLQAINEPLRRAVDEGRLLESVVVEPGTSVRDVAAELRANSSSGIADVGTGAAAKILALLAQYPNGIDKARIYPLAGYSKRATTVRGALSKLRGFRYIENTADGKIVLTKAGAAATRHVEPLPTGEALLDHWRSRLGEGAARRIFDLLVERYPTRVLKANLYTILDYSPDATTVRGALSKLRGFDLIVEEDGHLIPNPSLMEAS